METIYLVTIRKTKKGKKYITDNAQCGDIYVESAPCDSLIDCIAILAELQSGDYSEAIILNQELFQRKEEEIKKAEADEDEMLVSKISKEMGQLESAINILKSLTEK